MHLTFTLNGEPVTIAAPAHITLLRLLRDYLRLTGTKEGCDIGECGACSVLVDGQVVAACLTLAPQVSGRTVTTIEGLRNADGGLTDIQQAFVWAGAVQCGYCIPGLVIATAALLHENPTPTRTAIREAIGGNLCRCTGYQQIVDAIEQVAASRQQAADAS